MQIYMLVNVVILLDHYIKIK